MYQFKEERDHVGEFWFDRKLIQNKNWSLLPKASKSIYPAIMYFRNSKTGVSFADQETLAILSGLSEKTVSDGIKGLDGFPDIEIISYITKRGKRSNKFKITVQPIEKGRSFPIKKTIFEGGNWSQLKPTAQALYPVLRHYGWFDLDMYSENEDLEASPSDFDIFYPGRKYDFFDADLILSAEHAGFSYRSVKSALNSLEECSLIERWNAKLWKIYLTPPYYYKRRFLNDKIKERFAHKIRRHEMDEKQLGKNYGSHMEKTTLK
jgi:hypothetical protein